MKFRCYKKKWLGNSLNYLSEIGLTDHVDYSSNCHTDEDSEEFVNLWENILDKVKYLNVKQRKKLIGKFIDKHSHFYDLHIDRINQDTNWFRGLK